MLKSVASGVWVRESEFLQSNTTVIDGRDGVLVVDPGITEAELAGLADDLRELGRPVAVAFSTHPDWDHVLWHPDLGDPPRYATARGAASIRAFLAQPDWIDQLADGLPPEHADEIPMHLLGLVTALPDAATHVPWNGPAVRILEHRAHAPGHAALLVEDAGVLVAGDMLSDILMPFLDLDADQPLQDYLDALDLVEEVADRVRVVVPGHGSVGDTRQLRARIALDRAYVAAVRNGHDPDDPRVAPDAPLDWLRDVHEWQLQRVGDGR